MVNYVSFPGVNPYLHLAQLKSSSTGKEEPATQGSSGGSPSDNASSGAADTSNDAPAPVTINGWTIGMPVEIPTADWSIQNLTPDSLFAYCQSRLSSLDSQMTGSLVAQQRGAAEISAIDKVQAGFDSYKADIHDKATCTNLEKSMASLINSLKNNDPNSPALPGLTQAYNNLVWSGDGGKAFNGSTDADAPDFIDIEHYPPDKSTQQGDGIIGSTEMSGYVQALTDAASSLNSTSELSMIQLQSLMSQRQTAISLTTNLVQALGDQANKVVDNIGH
jgi:hypothetical protein